MLTNNGAKALLAAVVSLVFTVLLACNAFFVNRLIEKIDVTSDDVVQLKIQVARIFEMLQNRTSEETALNQESRDAWNSETEGPSRIWFVSRGAGL